MLAAYSNASQLVSASVSIWASPTRTSINVGQHGAEWEGGKEEVLPRAEADGISDEKSGIIDNMPSG